MGRKAKYETEAERDAARKARQYDHNKYAVYIRKDARDALHRERLKLQKELGISLNNTQALTLLLLRMGKEESGG